MGDDSGPRQRRIDVPILDLDRVAAIIADQHARWDSACGLVADPVTWMDADADWPRPLLTDRSQADTPMSVGVIIRGVGPSTHRCRAGPTIFTVADLRC